LMPSLPWHAAQGAAATLPAPMSSAASAALPDSAAPTRPRPAVIATTKIPRLMASSCELSIGHRHELEVMARRHVLAFPELDDRPPGPLIRPSGRVFVEPDLIHRNDPLNGEAQAHQAAADDDRPGEGGVDLGQVPGTDVDDHGEKRQGNDGRLEPYWPHIGMAEDQPHDEEDEGHAEYVNVRDAHQSEEAHPGVDLADLGHILIATEIGDVGVAPVMAGEASLLDDRLDARVVFG